MEFQFDLTDHAGLFDEFDHAVVLGQVKARNFHRQDVHASSGAGLHLPKMLAVGRRQHGRLDLGMPIEHLLFVVVAGHSLDGPLEPPADNLVFRTRGDPVELG